MQKIPRIPGTEGSRRAGWVAIVGLITLGLVLGLGSLPAQAAQLTVSWSDATPDDHTGFKVERKTGTTGAFAQVATTGATVMAYVDTTLTAGTTYCYRVRAYNAVGDSPYTPEACAAAPTAVLRTLTVAKSGTGTGTVNTSPAGISCGSTCSATYASGTSVALSATPNTGSTFTGWSGACSGTSGCALVLDANKSATATFALSTAPTSTLTVTKAGTGSGTVTSSPSGITCGSTCSASYNSGTNVTLTAAASFGSTFSGWSGACTGTGTCTVSMTAARSVTATFAGSTPTTYALTVTKAGTGSGTVTSSPSGITCGSTCSASYNSGTNVTLTAAASFGSTFSGWSGACTGTGTCTVSMTAARSVTATFAGTTPTTYALTVTKSGTGTGTVTSSPSGITCGSTCSASYNSGTNVTLTAAAATGATFTGWSGACTGTGTCTVSMTAAKSATASFALSTATPAPLTISSVTATQGSPLVAGTPLTLTATATGGTAPYQFKWWVWNGSTWTIARDWGTGNTLTGTTPPPGNYEVHAWVRNSGVTADTWQAWGRLAYTVTGSGLTMTLSRVTADQGSSLVAGTPLTLTAAATGGTTPYQFKWWVWNGSAWTIARNWGTGNTLTWTPPAPGNYEVHAWVRNSGVTADTWQAWGRLAYTVR